MVTVVILSLYLVGKVRKTGLDTLAPPLYFVLAIPNPSLPPFSASLDWLFYPFFPPSLISICLPQITGQSQTKRRLKP